MRDTTCYDVNEYCHNCGILDAKGNTDHPGCDMEICPACGRRLAFDDMHDEILVSHELPEAAKLTLARYDAEFRKKQEEIRKWQIQEFCKVICISGKEMKNELRPCPQRIGLIRTTPSQSSG